jgi:vacuolar-type H+-ATPase subunit H
MANTQAQTSRGEKSPRSAYDSSIQEAVEYIASMEKQIDELSGQVADMKKKLKAYAEDISERAKSEVVEAANKESEEYLRGVRASSEAEAKNIVSRGDLDSEALRKRVSGKIPRAVDVIVQAVLE